AHRPHPGRPVGTEPAGGRLHRASPSTDPLPRIPPYLGGRHPLRVTIARRRLQLPRNPRLPTPPIRRKRTVTVGHPTWSPGRRRRHPPPRPGLAGRPPTGLETSPGPVGRPQRWVNSPQGTSGLALRPTRRGPRVPLASSLERGRRPPRQRHRHLPALLAVSAQRRGLRRSQPQALLLLPADGRPPPRAQADPGTGRARRVG